MLKRIILFTLLSSSLISTNVFAKWWIFGQDDKNVSTRYLYLNDLSFDELDEQVTLYRDMLPEGRVILRGKADGGSSQIGKVEVSLDNRETWQKAVKSDDGGFQFSFVPELNQAYKMYVKILNTSGKSNEVEETYREITVSDATIESIIRESLDALIAAYQDEDSSRFMNLVDEDFAGDFNLLDRAIRKDFSAFDALNLRYTLNNVVSSSKGKVYVALSYNRQVTSTRSGQTLTDQGLTEIIFNLNNKMAKVIAMKNPLIFGLSDASNVGTGTVNSNQNDQILITDEMGNMQLANVSQVGESVGTGLPEPSNLIMTNQAAHHFVSLAFNVTPNVIGNPNYEVVLEESLAGTGPWTEVYRNTLSSGNIDNFTSTNIATHDGNIYYRIIIERVSDSEQSDPSNVLVVNNN